MKRLKILTAILICATLLLATVGCKGSEPNDDSAPDSVGPTLNSDGFDEELCTFFDTFDGDEIDRTKWAFQTGDGSDYGIPGWGNNEQQYYREENAELVDGCLVINAYRESFGGKKYTSSKLVTNKLFSQKYGRFEARIKLSHAEQGLWPAFWMMPEKSVYGGWPKSGEIDIMELKGRFPKIASSAIHYGTPHTYDYGEYTFKEDTDITDFHLYTIDWYQNEIRMSIDGEVYRTYSAGKWFSSSVSENDQAPFDQEFFLILNLAIGGNFDGGRVPANDKMPAQLVIDFVRVYDLKTIPLLNETNYTQK